jgi:3-phosphoshikimate 1-carboxyvinyltransferase
MSFSLASFTHPGDEYENFRRVAFDNPNCVEKTYPDFFDEFARVCSEAVRVITIDGPTASGKGTIADKVSTQLGFKILDSGCFYRVLALVSARSKIDENDEANLKKCAESLNIKFFEGRVFLEEEDITDKIREENIGIRASKISVYKSVRKTLLRSQRDFARHPGLVADGRDMGSIVFPNAFLKVFLSANAKIRAERRYKQLIQKEIPCKLNDLLQEIKKRDHRDINRDVGSLILAKEACSVYIDTSSKSIDEVVRIIIDKFNEKTAL